MYSKGVLVGSLVAAVIGSLSLYILSKRRHSKLKSVGQVSQLNIFPIKSCQGIGVTEADLGPTGFINDRRWMIVESSSHRFLTQRQIPKMVWIRSSFKMKVEDSPQQYQPGKKRIPKWSENQGFLSVDAPGMANNLEISINSTDQGKDTYDVGIWKNEVKAVDEGDEAAKWFSEYLSRDCRLVRMASDFKRNCAQKYSVEGFKNITGFADGFPFLLTSEESLDDLNSRMNKPVQMIRFRPNIVVKGVGAYAEDNWKILNIGGIRFHNVKPCSRCKIPTIDPEKAIFDGNEPTETLLKYRAEGTAVFFWTKLDPWTISRNYSCWRFY